MTKNCSNDHVSETVGGQKLHNSWYRRILCVICFGDALAVLLQFIHAAIISQSSVLYNYVRRIWSRLKNAVMTLVLKDFNLKLRTLIQTSLLIKLNCGMKGS